MNLEEFFSFYFCPFWQVDCMNLEAFLFSSSKFKFLEEGFEWMVCLLKLKIHNKNLFYLFMYSVKFDCDS